MTMKKTLLGHFNVHQVLNRDLGLIEHFRLQSTDDLVKITELARDREQWRELSARIENAAEASQTMNWDATRQ